LGWVHTKVSRIQNGRQIPTAEEIREWSKACGHTEDADDLVGQLEQISTQRLSWRHWLAAANGRVQGAYNELFRQSTKVEMFENETIPGVIQTPSYAAAVLGYLLPLHGVDAALVDDEVAARMERGRYLHDPTKQFDLLMSETALLSGPASAEVLATQIEYMLRLSELPNVRIGIVPLRPGLPVAVVSPFSIHELISGDVVVISEVLHGELPNLQDSLDLYRRALTDLWGAAATDGDARALIEAAIEQLRS
jgi:hypothetical protein